MKLNKLFLFGILVTLLCPPAVIAQEKAMEKLGQVNFPVSCSAAAQKQFDQALGALHSFWYEEALRLFTGLAETDPGCAMAYWGIAMSIYYPLWVPPSQATLQKGMNAIEKAKSIGANGVLNVRFATTSITMGAAEILAYGSAVRLEDA